MNNRFCSLGSELASGFPDTVFQPEDFLNRTDSNFHPDPLIRGGGGGGGGGWGGSTHDLQLPLLETNFFKRSFSYRGAMAWNQLSN